MTASLDAECRIECDSLGEIRVPAAAYYGVHTARALANFAVSGNTLSRFPVLIESIATVKQAASMANEELGLLDPERAGAIQVACVELRNGMLHDHFPLDPIQGGAGTSTNMNANEVIANRGLEIMGFKRGDYKHLDPLEHVNLGQSTNDVYPTAVRMALTTHLRALVSAMGRLAQAFDAKSAEFEDVLKMGRTQLQDAVPMTLGQEFGTYALMLREDCNRLLEGIPLLLESNLGGTAIGTGINGHPEFSRLACGHLRELSGEAVRPAENLIEATQDCGAFVQISGIVKRAAVKLSKTCNDLRLISSGPTTGFREINLPAVQAGSSIMPGKVNPVIPELVNQVAFDVIGSDLTVTLAAEAGQLQLNAFEPVIAYSLLRSTQQLTAAVKALAENCVAGISANRDHLRMGVDKSVGIVTAFSPYVGYATSAAIAKEALASGEHVGKIAVRRGVLSTEQVEQILSPRRLAGLDEAPAGESERVGGA